MKETEELLQPLRKKTSRNIQLPQYITFTVDATVQTLYIYIKEQRDKNGNMTNATCKNMQSDNAAFEGWAICIKAWLPEMVSTVVLKWDAPTPTDNERLHYNRFLYRVFRFAEMYDWFSVAMENDNDIQTFKNTLTGLQNNSFSTSPGRKGHKGGELSETGVEYMFAHELSEPLKEKFDLETIDRQLPVGVKSHREPFFTGGMSAIDLWGMKDDVLTIIELKYNGVKSKNIKVGIISELFLYSCIMRDMIKGNILPPDDTPNVNEAAFYKRLKSFRQVKAYMLSNQFHPLVDNEQVIAILNANRYAHDDILMCYGKASYGILQIYLVNIL